MNGFIGAVTLIVTAVGLWLAHNYRRQMTLKLSETRLQAYSHLWEITGIAAPTRLDGWGDDGFLRLEERRELWAAMTDWYYANGGGMLLAETTKKLYLNVKHDLLCEWSNLRPAGLGAQIELLEGDKVDDDKVRGNLAITLISLLRTQLKSDLAIYGSTYASSLNNHEIYFLEQSGVNLRSEAWASAVGYPGWQRMPLVRAVLGRSSTKKPQKSPPSPLMGRSGILDVGNICQTPPSSRLAIKKALRGGSSGSIEADTDGA